MYCNKASRLQRQLWFDVANWFATLSPDLAVHHLLERLGTLHTCDRVWLAQYSKGHTHVRTTHEWCAHGISSTLANRHELSTRTYRYVQKRLLRFKEVHVTSPASIPNRYQDLKIRWAIQGVHAFYCVPVLANHKLVATLGYHRVIHAQRWSRADRAELRRAAEFIGNWLHAKTSPPSMTDAAPLSVDDPVIFIKQGADTLALPVPSILNIAGAGNYSVLYRLKDQPITQHRSLARWETALPMRDFLRVHRSHLVNTTKITKLTRGNNGWKLTMVDHSTVPVGRQYQQQLARYMDHRQTNI